MKLLNSMFTYPFVILGLSFGLTVSATASEYKNLDKPIEHVEDNYTQQELTKLYIENFKFPENSTKSYLWFANREYAPAQYMLGDIYSCWDW